ncbi:MAG TPA: hypothetical protein PLB21_00645 [Actinomycetota bacterium]|nr:hypothetical protein [Actinomycetota bacterium]
MKPTRALALLALTTAVSGVLGCTPSAAPMTPAAESTVRPATRSATVVADSTATASSADSGEPLWTHVESRPADVQEAAKKRIFFGHQSVGGNVMKGVTELYQANGLGRPPFYDITDGTASLPSSGGVFAHAFVGRNGDPLAKLADFDAILRDGVAKQVYVALLKFCYADVRAATDVDALFAEYRDVLAALERDYPKVTFLHATSPLKTTRPEDNLARAQFNTLIRAEYAGTGRLWDIAAVESTTPEGDRVSGMVAGARYDALYPGFSTDGGHLNPAGAEAAATPLLRLVAQS